ncbi:hypothetical protein T4D_6763 [Trichinella pseudospiralis]|uniref:Uncharacterized protein n=1 Tax=Trichinella pseudospiralis TaxID=6337 RepID=A0A0V1FTK7_TRIPS|nr:hypothetical protein T4D_6763 [Trichinella pseudospiralis]
MQISFCRNASVISSGLGSVKLMMQKKVKARMTPSKSWTTLRRKIDEKRHAEIVYILTEFFIDHFCRQGHFFCQIVLVSDEDIFRLIKRMKQRKSENADDVKQITNGTTYNTVSIVSVH